MDFKEAAREVGSVFIIHPRSFPNFRRSESGSLLNFYFPIKLWDEILEPVGKVNSWAKKGGMCFFVNNYRAIQKEWEK